MSTSANHDNPVQPRLYSARVDTAAAQFRHRVRPPWYRPAGRATAGSRLPWIPRWPAPGRPVTHAQDRDDPVPWRPPPGSRGSVPSLMVQARHVVHQRPSTQFHSRVPVFTRPSGAAVSPPQRLKTCPKNSSLDAGCVGAADHRGLPAVGGSVRSSSPSASPDAPGRRRHLALPGPAARVLRLAVGAPHPPPCGQRGTDRGDIASAIRAADAAGNAPAPLGAPRHGGMNRALREAARKPGPALPSGVSRNYLTLGW